MLSQPVRHCARNGRNAVEDRKGEQHVRDAPPHRAGVGNEEKDGERERKFEQEGGEWVVHGIFRDPSYHVTKLT